jgi:hypothetical protein
MLKKLSVRRPSPALIISMIALIVAMGGTGYAAIKLPAGSVGTKQLKKNAVTGAKVKNRSLTGADINLSSLGTVPAATNAGHADVADSAKNASNATNAAQATNAAHATAADTAANGLKAYALVNANGTVDPENSFKVTNGNVSLKGSSAFCFHDLPFTFHGAIATVRYTGGGAFDEEASFGAGDPAGDCLLGGVQHAQAEVATTKADAYTALPFFVVFY